MAIVKSAKAKFEVYVTDAYVDLGPVSVDYDYGINTEETTHLQSAVTEEAALLDNPTFTVSGHVDLANTGFLAIQTAAASADKTIADNDGTYSMKLTLEDESTAKQLASDTIVTAYSEGRDAKSLPTFTATLKCNSAVG